MPCITRDTVLAMSVVSIRELRNHGGAVVDRVSRGEQITITRDGTPVAELRPVDPPTLTAEVLIDRWRSVPAVDPIAFRADIDAGVDPDL
jgi:prevent-host-death family protein